jgi:predicted RNA methylase
MTKRPAGFELRAAARDPSFVPAKGELPALVELLANDDDAEAVERALGRAGAEAAKVAMARFDDARPPLRGRLVRAVARAALPSAWLLARLDDADLKTRRNAIVALGKATGPAAVEVEGRLCEAYDREARVEHKRSIAASLGKVGGVRALSLLRDVRADDPELRRIVDEAILKLTRTAARGDRGHVVGDAKPTAALRVRFLCRRGLEGALADEVADLSPEVVEPGVVEVHASASLGALFRARTALRFSFPASLPPADTHEARVARAVAGLAPVLATFTDGPITYRIEWAGAGHQRAATYRVARDVSRLAPELRNDPTGSLWEVVVGREELEVWPKGLADPRFAYRVADVPASSHPTVAAALARVGGVRGDDVVWDPFVGAGTELIERARLGPYRSLYGCDLDPRAVEATRRNLSAAGVSAVVVEADARACKPPEPVSLVISNPPMGRRVLDRAALEPLFEALLTNVRGALRRDGRVVMLSPLFGKSAEMGTRLGYRVERRGAVDLGGFDAELQVFRRTRAPAEPPKAWRGHPT